MGRLKWSMTSGASIAGIAVTALNEVRTRANVGLRTCWSHLTMQRTTAVHLGAGSPVFSGLSRFQDTAGLGSQGQGNYNIAGR
jgi:hypothetical protein